MKKGCKKTPKFNKTLYFVSFNKNIFCGMCSAKLKYGTELTLTSWAPLKRAFHRETKKQFLFLLAKYNVLQQWETSFLQPFL